MGVTSYLLTEKPESPELSGSMTEKFITRIYSFNSSLMDDILTLIPGTGVFDDSTDRDGFFIDYNISSGIGYGTLKLQYTNDLNSPGSSLVANNLDVKYSLNINMIDKMLEETYNTAGVLVYRTNWNYNLFEKFKVDPAKPTNIDSNYPILTFPSWWATSKSVEAYNEADGIKWVWSKSIPAREKDDTGEYFWKKSMGMTKPGQEVFLRPQAEISEKKYCKHIQDAENFLIPGTGLRDPAQRFRWPASSGGVYRWLAYPVGLENDGKYWIGVNKYLYSDKWDTDGYWAI